MRDSLLMVLAFAAGCGLGAAFFAGLWWTVRHSLSARRPGIWILGSLLARTALLLAGFYYISGGHWPRLLACVLGFVTTKLVVTRLALPMKDKEAIHAS